MAPGIILHNSVSLDCSLTGFMPDMVLHYQIAGSYKPDAHLIGSETVITGNEMFGEGIPDEIPSDFEQPQRSASLPWWIIADSGGKLKGMLHTCRRFEYCRDLIILVSESTPSEYISYLDERKYIFIRTGKEKADLRTAINILSEKYSIRIILTDTGQILGNLLLNMGLVGEISLLVHPVITGEKSYNMFSGVKVKPDLKLIRSEKYDNGCVWNVYSVGN